MPLVLCFIFLHLGASHACACTCTPVLNRFAQGALAKALRAQQRRGAVARRRGQVAAQSSERWPHASHVHADTPGRQPPAAQLLAGHTYANVQPDSPASHRLPAHPDGDKNRSPPS
eukprot:scaffold26412_cov80-Isochrysis_galbana.AAC.3